MSGGCACSCGSWWGFLSRASVRLPMRYAVVPWRAESVRRQAGVVGWVEKEHLTREGANGRFEGGAQLFGDPGGFGHKTRGREACVTQGRYVMGIGGQDPAVDAFIPVDGVDFAHLPVEGIGVGYVLRAKRVREAGGSLVGLCHCATPSTIGASDSIRLVICLEGSIRKCSEYHQ